MARHSAASATLMVFSGVGLALSLLTVPNAVHASAHGDHEAGAALFHEKGCEQCHGVDAAGTDKGPSLATIGRKWKREQIEGQILEGGGGMPAFRDVLLPDETKALVEYLHQKRKVGR